MFDQKEDMKLYIDASLFKTFHSDFHRYELSHHVKVSLLILPNNHQCCAEFKVPMDFWTNEFACQNQAYFE